MRAEEVVSMLERRVARGSAFRLIKLEPISFGGQHGFRFEYAVTRKLSNLELSGVGYGAISKGELFAIVYAAPRSTFFDRYRAAVEQIARSVRIKA